MRTCLDWNDADDDARNAMAVLIEMMMRARLRMRLRMRLMVAETVSIMLKMMR